MVVGIKTSKPKRLTPKPDVLRELYLLSGNNCAVAGCKNVIIDHAGVVVGHICHIEAAMPNGARFNKNQTNEQRRALVNLVLICAGHHAQIDSKKHEKKWTVHKLRKMKESHETKFKGLDDSLEQAFQKSYVDSTDSLMPTPAKSFAKLDKLLPDCGLESSDEPKRLNEMKVYLQKLCKVPNKERQFMLGVITRAIKLNKDRISVHVDDINGALEISHQEIKSRGKALKRYDLGCVDDVGSDGEGEYHVIIYDPSSYLRWIDIYEFCKVSKREIEHFLIGLDFGLLD